MEGALGVLLVAGAVIAALMALRKPPSPRRDHAPRGRRSGREPEGPGQVRPGQRRPAQVRPGQAASKRSVPDGVGPVGITSALERLSVATDPGPGSPAHAHDAPPTPLSRSTGASSSAHAQDATRGASPSRDGGRPPASLASVRAALTRATNGQDAGGGPSEPSAAEGPGEPSTDGGTGDPSADGGPSGHGRHRGAGDPHATAHADSRRADGTPARSRLFQPGAVDGPGAPHHGPYACLHLHTTGLTPGRDRILEVAVVRCDAAGEVASEWSTVLDPEGREVSAGWFHGLTPGALQGAPTFADVASELLTQCEGAVVVAHHADFVESFVAGALLRSGVLAPSLPVLPLARLAAVSIPAPNTRLATLGALAGRPRTMPSGALADARILAAVLPRVLGPLGGRIRYPVEPIPHTHAKHRRRPVLLPRGTPASASVPSGYLADLLAAVPASAAEQNDPRLAAYLDALMSVLVRGIVAQEVRELMAMAVRSGYRADAIRAVHQRVLESLRATAFGRGRVGQTHVRHLRAVAHSLGIPGYFDDLVAPPAPPAPPPGSGSFSRPVRKPPPPTPPAQSPRCGHCLGLGHYTAQCPQLRRRRGGSVGPVGGVPGFGPIDPISPI